VGLRGTRGTALTTTDVRRKRAGKRIDEEVQILAQTQNRTLFVQGDTANKEGGLRLLLYIGADEGGKNKGLRASRQKKRRKDKEDTEKSDRHKNGGHF